jgi:Peptidase A4 family
MTVSIPGIAPGQIRTHPAPPEGFDARRATPLELILYGLPQRPDPAVMPALAARWNEAFSRPLTYITPTFQPMEEVLPDVGQLDGPQLDANANNSIWSGSVVTTTTADKFKSITGQWNVPDVAPAAAGAGSWYSVAWIGIDGFGGNDVCQIGTVQAVTVAANGNVTKSCYAWFEWFPQSWQAITNFPVSMGDTLTGLLCIQSPTEAGFNLLNVTTGAHTGFTFDAPAGTTLVGNTAEWILERPGINGSTAQLPDFGEVYFDSAIASNSTNTAVDAGTGIVLNMVENGATVATTTVETPTLIKVAYTAA